jgi:hypothetical protein
LDKREVIIRPIIGLGFANDGKPFKLGRDEAAKFDCTGSFVMVAVLRSPLKIKNTVIPKGTQGNVLGVSNSKSVRESYPDLQNVESWFYIVKFPEQENTLVNKSQIDII